LVGDGNALTAVAIGANADTAAAIDRHGLFALLWGADLRAADFEQAAQLDRSCYKLFIHVCGK